MDAAVIARRVAEHARDRGPLPVLGDCASWGVRWAAGRPFAGRPTSSTFRHEGAEHRYLRHRYNWTWLNERAVEVPLAGAVLDAHPGARVLEVGNVLGHYRPGRHTVVDKYERGPGVHNVDVVDLPGHPELAGPYDLVLAVSTLEHVGFDEAVRDPDKAGQAFSTLAGLLAPGGRLWATVPVGYNPDLQRQLLDGGLGVSRLTALRRTGRDNRWAQVPVEEVRDLRYDWLLYTATALLVAEIVR